MRIILITALLCYIFSFLFSVFRTKSIQHAHMYPVSVYRGTIFICVILHGSVIFIEYFNLHTYPDQISQNLTISISIWLSVFLYLFTSFFKQTLNLGIILLPLGLIGVLIQFFNSAQSDQPFFISYQSILHVSISILTYSVLFIAFAQAMLLFIQEKNLHRPNVPQLTFLPPIETMESNLCWMIIPGFILLTFNLLIGTRLSWIYYGKFLLLNQHVIFSIIAWVSFTLLLLGKKFLGWRGENVATWTMVSFSILAFGYFGTRILSDFI